MLPDCDRKKEQKDKKSMLGLRLHRHRCRHTVTKKQTKKKKTKRQKTLELRTLLKKVKERERKKGKRKKEQ